MAKKHELRRRRFYFIHFPRLPIDRLWLPMNMARLLTGILSLPSANLRLPTNKMSLPIDFVRLPSVRNSLNTQEFRQNTASQ